MYCSNCAERLPESAVYCPSCGIEIRQKNPMVPMAPEGQQVPVFQQQPVEQDPFAYMPPVRTLTLSQRTKKLILLGMAAIAILFVVIKFTEDGGGQATPEKTVKGFMNAALEEDAQQMVSYMLSQGDLLGSQDLDSLVDSWEKMFEQGAMEIQGYKIIEINEEEDSATVKYMIDINRDTDDRMEEETFELTKVEGKWFILLG